MKVFIKLLHSGARLPEKMSKDAAGYDIYACLEENMIIEPQSVTMIPTGFAMSIPSGYEAQIRPRSGLAIKHGIGILNSPGTIDSDYRGEIKVIMFNFGKEPFTIENGMRIAQMIINKYESVAFEEVEELSSTKRGEGGFGHTGVK